MGKDPDTADQQPPAFRKSLGLIELVSLGVGGTIGSGIFVVPGIAARILGPASLLAWIVVAVSASCVLLSLAGISSRFQETGGFFGLFSAVFGNRIALPVTALYLVSSAFGIATIAAGISQYLGYFGSGSNLSVQIGIIALFCAINIVGISLSAAAENVMTALKTLPLIIIALILIPHIRLENFAAGTGAAFSVPAFLATIIIVYWPFTGFEISAIPVDETRDIALVRRALLLVMAIVASVYLLLNIALIGSAGSALLAASPAPVAQAAGIISPLAGPVVAAIGIIAMLSALNAYIIATSRVLWNIAARYRLYGISAIGSRGTPARALVVSCGLSAMLLLISDRFDTLASVSVLTTLVPYIFFCLCSYVTISSARSRCIAALGTASTAAILILFFVL